MESILIGHASDLQVKVRNINLFEETLATLKYIENVVEQTKMQILILPGDFFEYPIPNDDERNLIYNHIGNLLNIKTLKKILIFDGNHDLEKENKKKTLSENNALSTISSVINTIIGKNQSKLVYLNKAEIFKYENFVFLPYALTDRENWAKLKEEGEQTEGLRIALYHAMIKEYVEDKKLPIKTDKLDSLDIFPSNTVVIAGDIHEHYTVNNPDTNVKFIYCGAPMEHTFGEGSYIKVSDSIESKPAPIKKINIYQVSDELKNACDMLTAPVELPKYVQYVTIVLDNKIPTPVILENIKNIEWSKLINAHNTRLFVKVKSSNLFIKQEQTIFDYIVQALKNTKVTVQFDYDKLVQKDNYVENPIIQEIIDSKVEVIETDSDNKGIITAENIDKLLLDNQQLVTLFSVSIDDVLKKIDVSNVSELRNDIIDLFKKQLALCIEQSSQRFDIRFVNVSCNNFMILKDTNLDLTENGITRILGTNGIGKTTLYRLIRWILSGTIMEGMKTNQVVQNNLLVFNKNLPDNNLVTGTLRLIINGFPIEIIRSVNRTWKRDVTDEQKLSQNWQDFISNSSREINLKLYDIDSNFEGEFKSFIGDNAELLIKKYFGETLNTLLFLDQAKIKSILTTPADKLNETILNYIGVDYLKKLEDNLDMVKEELMSISKPKISKESIREKIIDCDIFIEQANKEQEIAEKENESYLLDLDNNEKFLAATNDKLINIGNVENELESKNQQKSELENLLNESIEKYRKKPTFDNKEPENPDELLIPVENSIKNYDLKFKTNGDLINANSKHISEINTKFLEYSKEKINQLKENEKTLADDIISKENNVSEVFDSIYKQIHKTLDKLRNKYDEKKEEYLEIKNIINNLNTKNSEIEEQIKNGYCKACNRPFDNFTDEHKSKLLKEIENNNVIIDSKEDENKTLQDWFNKYNQISDKYNQYCSMLIHHKLDEFKTTDIAKSFVDEIENIEKINSAIKQYQEQVDNIKHKMFDYNDLTNKLIKHEIIDLSIIEESELIDLAKDKNKLLAEIESISGDNKKIIREKQEMTNYVNNTRNKYYEDIKAYQSAYNNWKKECGNIDAFNLELEKKIDAHKKNELKLLDILDEIRNIKLNKLPEYEKLINQKTEINNKISEIRNNIEQVNQTIQTCKLKINTYQHNKESYQKEYDNVLLYEKNQIIWKIYSKLIKNNFKDIVFEYYRSFLNNTLNHLLSDVNFKLYWNKDSVLTMISQKNGIITYQPVQLSSGMETTFLGLSLIYCMHILNVKNSVSHLFIDEISGTLNGGKELSYSAENYQELFVKILFKFKEKAIWLVDHHLSDIHDSTVYEVIPQGTYSIYERR